MPAQICSATMKRDHQLQIRQRGAQIGAGPFEPLLGLLQQGFSFAHAGQWPVLLGIGGA